MAKFAYGQDQTTCFMLGGPACEVIEPYDEEIDRDIRYLLLELLEMFEEGIEDDPHNVRLPSNAPSDGGGILASGGYRYEDIKELFHTRTATIPGRRALRMGITWAQDRARSGLGWGRRFSAGTWQRGRAILSRGWFGGNSGS